VADVARVFPSDFDWADRRIAKDIAPDDVFVTDMMVVVTWMDNDGQDYWRLYNATADCKMSAKVGLLELAKFQLVKGCGPSLFDVAREADDE
jgi:hypothetical protein